MRLGKLFAVAVIATSAINFVNAQPTDPNAAWIRLKYLGITPPSFASRAAARAFFLNNLGEDVVVDLTGQTGVHYVLVTTYVRATPGGSLGRLGIIDSYVNYDFAGVSTHQFPANNWDSPATDNDARKNVFSLDIGNSGIDSADDRLRNNSAKPYDISAPAPPDRPFIFKAAAGKTFFIGGATTQVEGPLYSFVLRVDLSAVNQAVIPIAFAQLGRPADPNQIGLATLFAFEFNPNFAPVVEPLDQGARILIPEPASMLALGTGLVGLLALRRRKK